MWDAMPESGGKLTKETVKALMHTTYAIREMTNYCINELKMSYILTENYKPTILKQGLVNNDS